MKFDVRRFELEGGLRLLVLPRPESPVAAVRAIVDAGQACEPRPGVALLAGRTLASGAGERSEERLLDELEWHGASLETGSVGFALKTLTEDLPFALEVAFDLLRRPRFEPGAVGREIEVAQAERVAEADLPRMVALRGFLRAVYGDHPLGRDPRGEPRSLKREDLLAYHRTFFAPGRTVLAVAGALDADAVRARVEALSRGWTARVPAPARPPAPPRAAASERTLPCDAEQVHLVTGHLGIRRADPDYPVLEVLDQVLGAGTGFTDRLSRRIREELGLAYTVGAGICRSAGRDTGTFSAYVACAPGAWRRALGEIVRAVRELREQPVEADELERVRSYLASSLVFRFQTAEDAALTVAGMEHFGLGLDYPRRYLDALERVSAGTLREAARRHLDPEALLTVAAGPAAALGAA